MRSLPDSIKRINHATVKALVIKCEQYALTPEEALVQMVLALTGNTPTVSSWTEPEKKEPYFGRCTQARNCPCSECERYLGW